jgi:hypothetical protein
MCWHACRGSSGAHREPPPLTWAEYDMGVQVAALADGKGLADGKDPPSASLYRVVLNQKLSSINLQVSMADVE